VRSISRTIAAASGSDKAPATARDTAAGTQRRFLIESWRFDAAPDAKGAAVRVHKGPMAMTAESADA
jgi:hypothetical protein